VGEGGGGGRGGGGGGEGGWGWGMIGGSMGGNGGEGKQKSLEKLKSGGKTAEQNRCTRELDREPSLLWNKKKQLIN